MEKHGKNRARLFIVGYVTVLTVLAVLGGMLFNEQQSVHARHALAAQKLVTDLAYCDLPRISVSMNAQGGQSSPRLRADVSLEVASKDAAVLEGYQPRIAQSLSNLLSKVTVDDLESKNALPKLRAEMLRAVNNSGAPVPVHDLLFRQLVIM